MIDEFKEQWVIGAKFVVTVIIFHMIHGITISMPFIIRLKMSPLPVEVKYILHVIQIILYVIFLPIFGYWILDFFYPAGKKKKFVRI